MVNNHPQEASHYSPLFFAKVMRLSGMSLFLLCISFSTSAQSLKKYYTSSMESYGAIYYIYPLKGFKNHKLNCTFKYDITYQQVKDSAVINFSYVDKTGRSLDSICFGHTAKTCATGQLNKIFIESKKSKWHYRYATKIAMNDLKQFYTESGPPQIRLFCGKEQIILTENNRKWKKQAKAINRILEMIALNQKK